MCPDVHAVLCQLVRLLSTTKVDNRSGLYLPGGVHPLQAITGIDTLTPGQRNRLYHALTPMSVPTPSWDQAVEHVAMRDRLWIAAGYSPDDARDAEVKNWKKTDVDPLFWETP